MSCSCRPSLRAAQIARAALLLAGIGVGVHEHAVRPGPVRALFAAKLPAPATQGDAIARACDGAVVHDDDRDGLDDACELLLAQLHAPVVMHSSAETNFPTDVDDFLGDTALTFRDDACDAGSSALLVKGSPSQADLLFNAFPSPCGGSAVTSDGSRSHGKHKTYFLADVDEPLREGSLDTRRWRTYVHAYPNDLGGVTLQYWRFYAFNRAFTNHGGDWEGIHVVLGRGREVAGVRLLGHTTMETLAPDALAWDGPHPVVYSEVGGHATHASGAEIPARGCSAIEPCVVSDDEPRSFVRQETWAGGKVAWPDGHASPSGGLLDMGEKSAPKHGQVFLRYSGLWGSPGVFYSTSGYWGPAFNETSMRDDGFTTAWCAGMAKGPLDVRRECWPETRER